MPRYRDMRTGQFIKESTYNRSVSHGGRVSREPTAREREIAEKARHEVIDSLKDYYDIEGFEYEDPREFDTGIDYE